ncbi:DUF1206 domain-containing protein [Nocardioides coralli]|uniref:DUF1206 domain-containing protein n=1 Tax=Nocardioides coralli TaxID=2872154 RepID=UPI001CA41622|nr:DUF1206 domain-containing protein [Nocardioides coralli]QZY30507.1 DUF1206 domain-containing protein [Nocardioides coralli]
MDLSSAAKQAHHSDALDHAVRAGLVAYGLVHLVIGWLALQIAFGERKTSASSTGAMHALADQPVGAVLVWLVALGLLLLVVWRLLQAWQGHRQEDGADKKRKQAASLLKAAVYGALGFSALKVALGDSKSGSGTDGLTAQLMGMPGGQLIVGLVGLGVLGYGGHHAYQGISDKFLEKIDGEGRSGDTGTALRVIGKVGYIAKGLAIAVIGGLFGWAALTHDPKKSGGLDQALQRLADAPFGQLLLVVVAVGIACYGVYAFARARHLSRS